MTQVGSFTSRQEALARIHGRLVHYYWLGPEREVRLGPEREVQQKCACRHETVCAYCNLESCSGPHLRPLLLDFGLKFDKGLKGDRGSKI